MNRRFITAICLLLALSLTAGCFASSKSEPAGPTSAPTSAATAAPAASVTATPSAEPTASPTDKLTPEPAPAEAEPTSAAAAAQGFFSGSEHAEVHFHDMSRELYDMSAFRARAGKLESAASAGEAERLYSLLLDDYVRLRTWSELAWIDFYASGGKDADLSDTCQKIDDMVTEAGDLLFSSASKALTGEASEEFSAFLGDARTADLADYEQMTDRESELLSRETELKLSYNELSERKGIGAAAMNREAGEIFLELIRVRNELAQIYGYDTYANYAYENVYGRDYTPEDAAALCEAVKPYARAYFRDCYYSQAFHAQQASLSAEELMDMLRRYAPRISERAAEAQQYMERNGLYILESSDTVSEVGFTTLLPWYNAPFLFDALYGGFYDVTSVFHEFGHYYDAFINPEPDPLTTSGSYDVFEIHSTALEALAMGWYDEIFGSKADLARIHTLDGLIYNVVSGCIYDEFLRYAYDHPDMTVDEINRAYANIALSYGEELYSLSSRYGWMYVSHNFESPFYYISYAASSLVSLQFLSLSEKDPEAAMKLYNTLVEIGAYGVSYEKVVGQIGLTLFTEDLDGIMAGPVDELILLCDRYEHSRRAA